MMKAVFPTFVKYMLEVERKDVDSSLIKVVIGTFMKSVIEVERKGAVNIVMKVVMENIATENTIQVETIGASRKQCYEDSSRNLPEDHDLRLRSHDTGMK